MITAKEHQRGPKLLVLVVSYERVAGKIQSCTFYIRRPISRVTRLTALPLIQFFTGWKWYPVLSKGSTMEGGTAAASVSRRFSWTTWDAAASCSRSSSDPKATLPTSALIVLTHFRHTAVRNVIKSTRAAWEGCRKQKRVGRCL
jgi:hypothetical protein